MLDEHVLSAFPSANKMPPIGLGHSKDSSSVDRRENFTDFLLQLLIEKVFNALEFDRKINDGANREKLRSKLVNYLVRIRDKVFLAFRLFSMFLSGCFS